MNFNGISILLPTRGRPHYMERLWNSIYNTANDKENLEIIFYIDDDDTNSIDKLCEMCEAWNGHNDSIPHKEHIKAIIGSRITMNDTFNHLYKDAQYDIFGLMGDDVVYESKDWDILIQEEFGKYPDGIALVYGDDGNKNPNLGTHTFITRNWVDVLGWAAPWGFNGDYSDTYMNDLAERINRKVYLKDVKIDHKHWSILSENGQPKGILDKTNAEKNHRCYGGEGTRAEILFEETKAKRIEEAKKLQNYIDSYYQHQESYRKESNYLE